MINEFDFNRLERRVWDLEGDTRDVKDGLKELEERVWDLEDWLNDNGERLQALEERIRELEKVIELLDQVERDQVGGEGEDDE